MPKDSSSRSPVELLTSDDIAKLMKIHPKTFRRKLRTGEFPGFPASRELMIGYHRWLRKDVEAWLVNRPAKGSCA